MQPPRVRQSPPPAWPLPGPETRLLVRLARVFASPRPSPGQALEDRSGGRVRAPSLAGIVDKGAVTDRLGYAHSTLAVRLRPTSGPASDRRRYRPGAVRKGKSLQQVVDNGAVTPHAWATAHTDGLLSRPPPGPEPRALPLAIPAQVRSWRPLRRRGWERGMVLSPEILLNEASAEPGCRKLLNAPPRGAAEGGPR